MRRSRSTLIIALLAWVISLWQQGGATTGDVVLVCTLVSLFFNATRDLAVALVDVTQHVARMTEAIATLLLPHELRDHPEAEPLVKSGAAIAFNNISFQYPGGLQVFEKFTLDCSRGSASAWSASPAEASRACSRCCSGSTTCSRAILPLMDKISRGSHSKACGRRFRSFAGHLALPSHDPGKHPLRAAERHRRRGAARGDCSALRFRRGVAGGARYDGRRSRCEIVGRPAAADRDRAGLPEGRADPALDEATAALDSESEEAIREALARLMRGGR